MAKSVSGKSLKESVLPKWIGLAAGVLAIIVVGMFLCFKAFTASHAAEPGVFQGAGSHKASGHVEIVKDGAVTKVVIKNDFTLQDAPAPRLAWGKDGYKRGSIFATLTKFRGAQEYVVPAGTDLTQYNQVWIWCEKFDVPLAVAKLN